MRLDQLIDRAGIKDFICPPDLAAIQIKHITDDSREIQSDSVFVLNSLSIKFLKQALQAGPALLLVSDTDRQLIEQFEAELNSGGIDLEAGHNKLKILYVPNSNQWQGLLAAALCDHPSRHLQLVGVTGTNGKTTVSHILMHLWQTEGQYCGMIGTLGVSWHGRAGEVSRQTGYTTPRAPELQKILALMLADGVTRVALEVSSEALDLGRLAGCHFSTAIFTNLSQDHLDHHGSLENYYLAKRLLFEMLIQSKGEAILFTADPAGKRILKFLKQNGHSDQLILCLPEPPEIALPVPTRFNRINAGLALLACHRYEDEQARGALLELPVVPGRFEPVYPEQYRAGQEWPDVVGLVDYAHTPDALENVLRAARELPARYIVCLIGCGGDRDPDKRPLMGSVAARLADLIIISDDNPRTEDPAQIRRQILNGVDAAQVHKLEEADEKLLNYLNQFKAADISTAEESAAEAIANRSISQQAGLVFEIGDRRRAIHQAVQWARRLSQTGPVLVMAAGKGHEDYQIIGMQKTFFSDRAELKDALKDKPEPPA